MRLTPGSRAAGRALGCQQLFQPAALPVPGGFPSSARWLGSLRWANGALAGYPDGYPEAASIPRLCSRHCCSVHGHPCKRKPCSRRRSCELRAVLPWLQQGDGQGELRGIKPTHGDKVLRCCLAEGSL